MTPKKVPSASHNSNRFQSKSDIKPAKSSQEVGKTRELPKTGGTSYEEKDKQILEHDELLLDSPDGI